METVFNKQFFKRSQVVWMLILLNVFTFAGTIVYLLYLNSIHKLPKADDISLEQTTILTIIQIFVYSSGIYFFLYSISKKSNPLAQLRLFGINKISKETWIDIGKIMVFVIALQQILILLAKYFSGENEVNILRVETINSPWKWVIAFVFLICTGVIAPILEEFLFRGILYGYLRHLFLNKTKANIINSIIFAILHFNPVNIIFTVVTTFLMTKEYEKEQNILVPIIIHSFSNIFVVLTIIFNSLMR